MRRVPSALIIFTAAMFAAGTLVSAMHTETYSSKKRIADFEERMVPFEIPLTIVPQRSNFLFRLREVLGHMRNFYFEISDIFEDGPTGLPVLERRFYYVRDKRYGKSGWHYIKNLRVKGRDLDPAPPLLFHKKYFFLNAGLS